MMNSSRDPTARLRAGLNPLLTASLGVYHGGGSHTGSNSTPLSAISMSSTAFSSAQTPLSAMQPYNPQEWAAGSPRPSLDGRSRHIPEPQASPPPPPPYSPPRSQRAASGSISLDASQAANISATRAPLPASVAMRISPEAPQANTSFPPPPGTRGPSRERRFGLPSLGRRREPEPQVIAQPDPRQLPPQHPSAITSRPQNLMMQAPRSQLTIQIPERSDSDSSQNLPPSSRRAVSTPAPATPTSASARSRSSSQVRWDHGMPLPPPPPGPPPARSQSAQRPSTGSEPIISPPTRRPAPSGVTALGPVPPTPANWVEENERERSQVRAPAPPPLQLHTQQVQDASSQAASQDSASVTASVDSSSTVPDSAISPSPGSAGLSRSHAVRGEKTLRERRNESRTRGSVRGSIDANMSSEPLSDIVIPSGGISRRLTISKGTPRSSRAAETPRTGDASSSSSSSQQYSGSGSTPRAIDNTVDNTETTPTFTPNARRGQATPGSSASIAPKALPTPPPHQSRSSSRVRPSLEVIVPTAGGSSATRLTKQSIVAQSHDQFSRGSIERFQAFARREAAASDDAERVRLFAEFFVSESRVRRERYSAAIGAMGSEIFDLTRDLFRPMSTTASRRESTNSIASALEYTPGTSLESRSHRGSVGSTFSVQPDRGAGAAGGSAPTSAGVTPGSPAPPLSGKAPAQGQPSTPTTNNPNWQSSNYMPSLSPILSMSVSDALDEQDSRGRPASRWWESASSEGHPGGRIERSKRESKYMGVPKEAREALQWADDPHAGSSSGKRESMSDYPPEKVGWHEEEQLQLQQLDQQYTPRTLNRNSMISMSTPNTPNPQHLDVSRLVTLPPPYPRHHPAVNNNHPELAETRASVRTLSDISQVDKLNTQFALESTARRAEFADAAKKRKADLRSNLAGEIGSGNIGYAEAAAIEADSARSEHTLIIGLEKADFDAFQAAVVVPLNELLQERIAQATALFESLRGTLFEETHHQDPNQAQEQGDERPELLEKLTLLKWVFEAREMLHRAVHDLLTERNDRYRDVVLTPYKLAGSDDKVASVTAFFDEDKRKRALADAEEVLRRTGEFRDVVQETVVRGVEVQLGAFWDIAPLLKGLLDNVPGMASPAGGDDGPGASGSGGGDFAHFQIQIPASEIEENPAYVEHPMQYLFSLLLHAEKSTYTFIEAQTNLLCLLHEVREAVVTAKSRVMELDGRDAARVEEMRAEETARLTEDLKEKVRLVQQQWSEGLGECISGVKERIGEWLLETGGWDESLEDGGVGSV